MYSREQAEQYFEDLAAFKAPDVEPVRAFDWFDGVVRVSAEEGNCATYYGFGGCPWIHPALEAWAQARGCFWEWMNPGAIALYPV